MNNEKKIIDELLDKFKNISKLGWVKSNRQHNTGIGKTFEDLLDKKEDNLAEPDYKGIEIKTHRSSSNSYTTLFTSSPSGPQKRENARLLDLYGIFDDENGQKKLHSSIFANRTTNFFNKFKFKIDVDRQDEKIYLCVYNMEDILIEKKTYWTFSDLKKCLERKLKTLAFVEGKNRLSTDGTEEFYYTKITILKFKTFEKFLSALENGYIMVDIRIGTYGSGINKGKIHDHGTGFRIKDNDSEIIYDIIEQIES